MLIVGNRATVDEVLGRIVVSFRQAVKRLLRGLTPHNDKQRRGCGRGWSVMIDLLAVLEAYSQDSETLFFPFYRIQSNTIPFPYS